MRVMVSYDELIKSLVCSLLIGPVLQRKAHLFLLLLQ